MGTETIKPAREFRLSYVLAVYALALIVPLLAYSGYILLLYTTEERRHADAVALDYAKQLAREVEQEEESIRGILLTLANSDDIAKDDLPAFHRQASIAARLMDAPVVLVDLTGQQLINTRLPFGEPLPRTNSPDLVELIRSTKRPRTSDLVAGAVARRPVVGIGVPVIRGDAVRFVLFASLEASRLAKNIASTPTRPDWIRVISDRQGVIVARSHDQEAFVGRAGGVRDLSPGLSGVHRVEMLNGGQAVRGYAFLTNGWLAAAFVPAMEIDAPLRRQWLLFALLGIVVLGFAMPLAFQVGRRISDPLARIAGAADVVDRVEPIPVVTSGIAEINSVSRALHDASARLLENARQIEEADYRFRAVFEQAAVGFEQWDLLGKRIGVNDRLCAMLGYTREECQKTTFEMVTHSEDRAIKQKLVDQLIKGDVATFTHELRFVKKTGEPMWVRVTSSLARDAAGAPHHRISVIEDVTDRRRARMAAARLASIVQSSNDAIFSVSPSGMIDTWNPGAEQLLGYSAAEILGKAYATLAAPDFVAVAAMDIERARAGESFRREGLCLRKDGTIADVATGLAPIRSTEGAITGISVTMSDITERKTRERQITILNRELQHRVKNSLAVVQSIVNQTLRLNPEPTAFRGAMEGRLRALAAANDLLLNSKWEGAELAEFIRLQLKPLMSDPARQLKTTGPYVRVPASLSVPLSLGLHELGTNALKYGALSVRNGIVETSWSVTELDGRRHLVLVWRERGGPPVAEPTRDGFGSILISRGIPRARVERRFEAAGFVCEITVPLEEDAAASPDAVF